MKKIFIQDKATFQTTARVITDEGFLSVAGRVAKSGIQRYLASELGLPGNNVIRVYRPAEEVFADASLETFAGADITVLHPKSLVTADNYKQTTVGTIKSKGRQDGDFVVADLLIKDTDAVKAVQDRGFVELSSGYTAEYEEQAGVTTDGEPYDFVQRNIRINHVALLPAGAARAGRQAKIFDNQTEGKTMIKVTLDNGRTVELQDEAAALLVSDCIDRLKQQVKDADKTADIDKMQATIDAQKEQIEKLQAETTDERIKERVSEVVDVKTKAEKMSGEVYDSLDVVEIQRKALAKIRPNIGWADKSEAYVQAAFDQALEVAPNADDQKRKLAADAAKIITEKPVNDARADYIKSFTGEK